MIDFFRPNDVTKENVKYDAASKKMFQNQNKILLLLLFSSICCGTYLSDRFCLNGEKPVPNCLHSQSGLCKPTNHSQHCIGSDGWRDTEDDFYYFDSAACSLDYVPASECASMDWPIFAYDARQPPFRLLLYRHHTWVAPPAIALNLSLAANIPTGIKFFFQHQRDHTRELCRKFSVLDPADFFVEDVHGDTFDGLLDNLQDEDNNEDADRLFFTETEDEEKTHAAVSSVFAGMSQSHLDGDSQQKRIADQNFLNTSHDEVFGNSSKSSQANVNLSFLGSEMDKETRMGTSNDSSPSKLLNSLSTLDQKRERRRRQRRSSMAVPPVLFWDCPMFPNGLEGEDFFLRLSDDGGWGAHLSFRVPHIKRHDRFSTPLKDWSVFHYVHLEHVSLESSVPVTLQVAPFPRLLYNVSLWHASCGAKETSFTPSAAAAPASVSIKVADQGGPKASQENQEKLTSSPEFQQGGLKPLSNERKRSVDSNGCYVKGTAIASVIVAGLEEHESLEEPPTDILLSAILPYQSAVGSYAVTVQILSPECGSSRCYVATSPVFSVRGGGYGRWIVVAVVVLLLLFLLSFTVMALIIRYQAEVASKKLWCRPRVLLLCCPHSPAALSLCTTLSTFLHHTAALTTTTVHAHLADSDPYQWMQYEMRTANKVLFLVPPRGKTVAKCSPVQQQWRLGVLSYAATHGALSSTAAKHDHTKFALLMLRCSGLVPAELSHMQRFSLPDDLVSLVTWLHDGTVLDRWFLWRPLVTHVEGSNTTGSDGGGTPYRNNKKKRKKKNSIIWSGCRRDQLQERIRRRDDAEEARRTTTCEHPQSIAASRTAQSNEGGGRRKNSEDEGVNTRGRVGDTNAGSGSRSCVKCNEEESNALGVLITGHERHEGERLGSSTEEQYYCPIHRDGVVSSLKEIGQRSSFRRGSEGSSSCNSSSTQQQNCANGSAYSCAETLEEHCRSNQDLSGAVPGQGVLNRPEWANEILGDCGSGSAISYNVEERMNFPVVQSAFAPTLVHLEEAVKLVEREETQCNREVELRTNANNMSVKPPGSSLSWWRRIVSSKNKHQASKPILEDVEEFSLYDNSMASNATTTTAYHQQQLQHNQNLQMTCDGRTYITDGPNTDMNHHSQDAIQQMTAANSYNTLCNVSMPNEEVITIPDDDDDENEEFCRRVHHGVIGGRVDGGGREDVEPRVENDESSIATEVSPSAIGDDLTEMDPMSSISFDNGNFDPLPNVSELPLLGEDLVSPNTETSSCQVEDDDDDFTAMLFGGTVSE